MSRPANPKVHEPQRQGAFHSAEPVSSREEVARSASRVHYVEVGKRPDLAARFRIDEVPTLVVVHERRI